MTGPDMSRDLVLHLLREALAVFCRAGRVRHAYAIVRLRDDRVIEGPVTKVAPSGAFAVVNGQHVPVDSIRRVAR